MKIHDQKYTAVGWYYSNMFCSNQTILLKPKLKTCINEVCCISILVLWWRAADQYFNLQSETEMG